MASKQGILDLDVVDYEMVFDTKVNLNLRKADRLIYGDSEMNHAMVLTGVHVEVSFLVERFYYKCMIIDWGNTCTLKSVDQTFHILKGHEQIPNGGTTNGYNNKDSGKVKKWRIENSWGEDRNEKGFITMTTEW